MKAIQDRYDKKYPRRHDLDLSAGEGEAMHSKLIAIREDRKKYQAKLDWWKEAGGVGMIIALFSLLGGMVAGAVLQSVLCFIPMMLAVVFMLASTIPVVHYQLVIGVYQRHLDFFKF